MEALKEYDQAEDRFERATYRFVTEDNRETVLQEAAEEEERQYRQKQIDGKRYAAESHVI